ncbi:Glycosyl hydrolase family 12 [Apiospora kogelbergensis]|uniref:Glycosyl hydrolase family 12 n=1 Tax=Apiospora kogelbergensis TaxID=1337665 RepID=UPI00313102B7
MKISISLLAIIAPGVLAQTIALCDLYAYHSANGYEILNNLWGKDTANSGSQCTYYNGPSGNGIAWSSAWTWKGAENNVKSYVYAGRQFTRRLVSQINSLPTSVDWTYNTTSIRANVAYDIFTSTDRDHVNSNGDYELMIWLNRYDGVWPITSSGQPIATVNIAGHTWDLYTGFNGAMRVFSFLAVNGPINSFSADVKDFFNYLIQQQGFPVSNQYMLIYQIGTEAFTGGPAAFTVSRFIADVN